MKALTIRQPWAELIVSGQKTLEVRSWGTSYRGWLGIHAAATYTQQERRDADVLMAFGATLPMVMPIGSMVGLARLVNCRPFVDRQADIIAAVSTHIGAVMPEDLEFCGCRGLTQQPIPGEVAWEFDAVVRLQQLIPVKGHQMLWDLPAQVCAELAERVHDERLALIEAEESRLGELLRALYGLPPVVTTEPVRVLGLESLLEAGE